MHLKRTLIGSETPTKPPKNLTRIFLLGFFTLSCRVFIFKFLRVFFSTVQKRNTTQQKENK